MRAARRCCRRCWGDPEELAVLDAHCVDVELVQRAAKEATSFASLVVHATSSSFLAPSSVRHLTVLDERLRDVLESGDIRLLNADFLRGAGADQLERIGRRQELEARDRRSIFVSPGKAVSLLRGGGRRVASLTYGWCTPEHPDPLGVYLAAVRRFLQHPLGRHVGAVFWDYSSLYQKPRTADQDKAFRRALGVMGDIYASALGVMVIRHETIPQRLAGQDEASWNSRPYKSRGWTTSETAVATEAVARAAFYPEQDAHLRGLPAKLIEIDRPGGPEEAPAPRAEGGAGAGPRIDAIRSAIREAHFTGAGDRDVVVGLYNEYVTKMVNAFNEGGEKAGGSYEGQKNEKGQKHGRGKYYYDNGDVYEGDWVEDRMHGRGTLQFADGDVYKGEYAEGKRHGRGKYRYPHGTFYEGDFVEGQVHGRGKEYDDGGVYEGEFADGRRHGRGKYRFVNGAEYEGEFAEGQKHGRGMLQFVDGDVYEGEFAEGKRHGHGKYQFADGAVYEGEYVEGKKHGRGTHWTASGAVLHEGMWAMNQPVC